MESNSIIALFLYRRRKRRRNRLNWVHAVLKERDEVCAFYRLFDDDIHRDEANKFLNYFLMSVSSFDELHRRLKESLHRRKSKMRNCIQNVEMLVVAIK
jgi:hypothetical protein